MIDRLKRYFVTFGLIFYASLRGKRLFLFIVAYQQRHNDLFINKIFDLVVVIAKHNLVSPYLGGWVGGDLNLNMVSDFSTTQEGHLTYPRSPLWKCLSLNYSVNM